MAPRLSRPRLKKRFGQHHLVRPEACAPLLAFLEPAARRVVEVGPGGGILTAGLAAAGARIDALEIDPEWAFRLRREWRQGPLRLAVCDVMDLDLGRWPPGTLLAGNLPYAISTALIQSAVVHHRIFPRAGFLVQKEVADRLLATPGGGDYGALTVLVGARAEVRRLGRVRRGAFHPPPKVEGAFVGLTLRPPPLDEKEMGAFTDLIRLAFANRRKTLRNSLAGGWGRERADGVLARGGLGPRVRAEELALGDFLRLFAAAGALGVGSE